MAVNVVPVIYDLQSKQVRRWFELDFYRQIFDPAFLPASMDESVIYVPIQKYLKFERAGYIPTIEAVQTYVDENVS